MFIIASVPVVVWIFGAIVSLIILFGLFHLTVSYLEKFHISDMVPATPDRPIIEAPYFTSMNESAARLGFQRAGLFVQNRDSKVYQAHMLAWISPDGCSLLRVSSGKTAGIEIKRTWLVSVIVQPEKIVETADQVTMADMSGITDRKELLEAGLDQLVAVHNHRLSRIPGERRPFPPEQALAACSAIQAMKVIHMQKRGLARFINPERTIWRHTFKGACMSSAKSLLGPIFKEEAP